MTKKKVLRNERGEIMIESMIAVVISLFALMVLLGFAFLVYQQLVMNIIANDVANKVAQTYALTAADPITGYIDPDDYAKLPLIRFGALTYSNRAKKFSEYSLQQMTLGSTMGSPHINSTIHLDMMSRGYITVTVTGTYKVPGGEFFTLFGIPKEMTYTSSASAETIDLLGYVNAVNTVNYLSGVGSGTDILGAVNKFLKIFA